MDALYALQYRELYETHWWWRARERFILATIRGLRPQGNWGSILDVGCGEGLSFDCLSKFGEVEGVETNPSLATKNDRWKHRIHLLDFEAFQSNKQYSLILMLDVLEHFSNPTACLRRSETLLDSTGSLLITVPAFSCLWTTHDDLSRHVSRFTKKSLSELISRTGLKIHACCYFFHWLFPVKILIHYKEMCFQTNPVVPKVPAGNVNALLYRLAILEQRVFSTVSLPFGSSLLAVCTKR